MENITLILKKQQINIITNVYSYSNIYFKYLKCGISKLGVRSHSDMLEVEHSTRVLPGVLIKIKGSKRRHGRGGWKPEVTPSMDHKNKRKFLQQTLYLKQNIYSFIGLASFG